MNLIVCKINSYKIKTILNLSFFLKTKFGGKKTTTNEGTAGIQTDTLVREREIENN